MPTHLSPSTAPDTATTECDVAILGGGIAGLTLALQLHRADANLRIEVIERAEHPAPEAAHKVGESSVEVQAHYLRNVLGLEEHLDNQQLRKFGLRMFMTHQDNTSISNRVEYGQVSHAPLPAYQLDRGRLENHLGQLLTDSGVSFGSGQRVSSVTLSDDGGAHTVVTTSGPQVRHLAARWVVDASGRAGLLKRQLGLAKPVDHHANASWLRIDHAIDVEDWSSDSQWLARLDCGQRRLSTNHLMGPGYWAWIIPLAGGATSVGLVAEAGLHDHNDFNTLPKLLSWLSKREPQLAADLVAHQDAVLDFKVMRDYAYSVTEVYNPNRWALTGEAGVSIDPLYSSGGDLMAISNSFITDLVTRDCAGEDVTDQIVAHNQLYLLLSEIWLVAYRNQYPVLGNAQAMVAKVIWDTIIYWAVPGLLYFQDKLPRLAEDPVAVANLYRTWEIHSRVQKFFIEWHQVDNPTASRVFADPYTLMEFLVDLHTGMADDLDDNDLVVRLSANVTLLEHLAGQLFDQVCNRLEDAPAAATQVATWRNDQDVAALISRHRELDVTQPIDPSWVRLGVDHNAHSEVA